MKTKYLSDVEKGLLARGLGMPIDRFVFSHEDGKHPAAYYHDKKGQAHNLPIDWTEFESFIAKVRKPQAPDDLQEKLKKQGQKIGELTKKLKEKQ